MTSWLGVWTRAVIEPAYRRAAAVWLGCALVGGVIFGPNGMQSRDLTGMALHDPGIGLVIVAIWLLVFAPTARVILRATSATYLRSLPHARTGPIVVGGLALVVLQLPWLALWLAGEGPRGLLVVAATTAIVIALAAWRPSPSRARWPAWRTAGTALAAIHVRALRRRAGDALIRGAGLAALAGATAALFVRNNALDGTDAATVGTSVMAIVLVPARIGTLAVVLDTHRTSGWLADTLGISRTLRHLAVARALALVHLLASLIALATATVIARPDPVTLAVWTAVALAIAASSALLETAALLRVQHARGAVAQLVGGALVVAALAVLALAIFGVPGVLAFAALGLVLFAL